MINKRLYAKNKSEKDFVPAYFKLQKTLLHEIEAGHWEPGASIPPERLLAETHKVSIGTVKRAILNLVNDGYLYRVQGSGTFVAGTDLRRESLRYYRFLKNFNGYEASIKIQFLELKKIKGNDKINRFLKLSRNQGLYKLRRLFTISRRPIVYTISYLSPKMFLNLEECPPTRFERISIFNMLEQSYGYPTIFNQELFSAISADCEVANLLEIKEGTSILCLEMLAFTYKSKPYEYRIGYCLTDERKIFREW